MGGAGKMAKKPGIVSIAQKVLEEARIALPGIQALFSGRDIRSNASAPAPPAG
jgi:hypothetical protein